MTELERMEWAINLNAVKHDVRDLMVALDPAPNLEVDLDEGQCILTTPGGRTEVYKDIPTLIEGLIAQGEQHANISTTVHT